MKKTITKGLFKIRVDDILADYKVGRITHKDALIEILELSEMLCDGVIGGYKHIPPPTHPIEQDYEQSFLSDPPNTQINFRSPESTIDG